MIGLLAQIVVTWSASAGVITAEGAYTAPSVATDAIITAMIGGVSGRAMATMAAREVTAGLAFGLSQWPAANYCAGPMTAALDPLAPKEVLARVQLAARCGVKVVIVPPRRFLTQTGTVSGKFVLDSAKRVTDQYALALPPDTLAKYRGTILGFNLADDYSSTASWGGEVISQATIGSWAAYAGAKLPGMPFGVRVVPSWVKAYPILAPLIDYAWLQWHAGKGDQLDYYNAGAADAKALGLKLVLGVAVANCAALSSPPCTAPEVVTYSTVALRHPAACAVINWKYDAGTWADPAQQAAYQTVGRLAATLPSRSCHR